MKKIHIKHFMSLEDVTLEFDERNILNLCGYNDSGKSAVTRSLEVMFFNSYSMDQVNFITDTVPGAEYWELSIEFKDGVVYTRRKYIDGSSVWELEKDTELIFTNRLPNGAVAAMSDTPEPIRDYLGVIKDEATDEKLNVRRNTDRLFLIETTGGDNYKILNSVLKSDVISEASRRLNVDKNKLNGNIASTKAKRELLEEQVHAIPVTDREIIEEIKESIEETRRNLTGLVRLAGVAEKRNDVVGVKVTPKVKEVSTTNLESLQEVVRGLKESSRPITPQVQEIALGGLQSLKEIAEKYGKKKSIEVNPTIKEVALEQLKELQGIIGVVVQKTKIKATPKVEEVETLEINDMKKLVHAYNDYIVKTKAYNTTMKEYNTVREELAQLSKENDITQCKNCGSLT